MFHQLARYTLYVAACLAGTVATTQETTVEAAPATIEATEAASKTTLAIFPFQSREKIDTRVAAAMVIQLSAAMEATEMFDLFDRAAMANLGSEVTFTRKDDINPQSAAAWGAERGVDYVITGMVVAAGKGHGGMGIGGVRISSKAIALAIDIRLIHCATGDILIEDTFKEEKTGLGLAVGTVEFDPESSKGSEMVAIVLRQLSSAILTTFHPPIVTAIDDAGKGVTLNYGQGVVEVGQRWEIFAVPETATNGGTGPFPLNKADKTGAIRIDDVQEKTSTASIVDGTAAVGAVARFDKAAKKKD